MKRLLAAAGLSAALVTTGCSQSDDAGPPAATDSAAGVVAEASTGGATAGVDGPAAPTGATGTPAGAPAAAGAPAFAVIYPGGVPKGEPVSARGPAGPGGTLEFTTEASPDEVIAFYRQRAEAAGLKAITSLNRDGARGYAAGDGADGRGQMLNVVATPVENGPTDVLLMWSSGR